MRGFSLSVDRVGGEMGKSTDQQRLVPSHLLQEQSQRPRALMGAERSYQLDQASVNSVKLLHRFPHGEPWGVGRRGVRGWGQLNSKQVERLGNVQRSACGG